MKWTLMIYQCDGHVEMEFETLEDLAEYMEDYRDMYGEETRFVMMNDLGPGVDIFASHYKAVYDKEPLPAALQD